MIFDSKIYQRAYECSKAYSYDWRPIDKPAFLLCAIKFTGFRVSWQLERLGMIVAQVLAVHTTENDKCAIVDIELSPTDPRWLEPFKDWFEPLLAEKTEYCLGLLYAQLHCMDLTPTQP